MHRSYMMANRLKNLAQVTRGAVRDVRRALEDILEGLSGQPKPRLVRIPVRVANSPLRGMRSPYGVRGFSTTAFTRAYAANNVNFRTFKTFKTTNFFRFVRTKPNLAIKLWPYSAFRVPLAGKGAFPGSLYRNFLNLGMRNSSNHGGSYSHDAVQNLLSGLKSRMGLQDASRSALELRRDDSKAQSYHGSSSQNYAAETLQFARCESTGVERLGAYVEFSLPSVNLTIPSVAFMNPEIMSSIQEEFEKVKQQIDLTTRNIELIFEAYGSLPIEKTGKSVRIHFPNLDAEEVEKLLIELSIKDGLVFTMDEYMMAETVSVDSEASLSDLMEERVPGLVSESELSYGSESDADSVDFFPVLSSSGHSQYVTPVDMSSSGPVIVSEQSEMSYVL